MIKMKYGVRITEAEWYALQRYYQDIMPKKMAIAANRTRDRMKRSFKQRSYTSKGKKPAPSTPGTPPHAISQPSSTEKTRTGRPKKYYRIKNVLYEKMGRLKYAVGVAPFASGGNKIMEVPKLHETGGTITRVRRFYHTRDGAKGKPYGQRKKISRKAKDAYLKKLRQGFAENNTDLLKKLGIWAETQTANYPHRRYLEPAAQDAANTLPKLFKFAAYVR